MQFKDFTLITLWLLKKSTKSKLPMNISKQNCDQISVHDCLHNFIALIESKIFFTQLFSQSPLIKQRLKITNKMIIYMA